MLSKITSLIFIALFLSGCAGGLYPKGDVDDPLSVKDIPEEGLATVLVSVRSQAQLTNNFYFYFIRDGAMDGDKSQMIKIYKAAGVPIVGTYSSTREYQLLNVEPGRYGLYAHTIGHFPSVRPNASVSTSPGNVYSGVIYERNKITFDVKPGVTTYIGNIWLEQKSKKIPESMGSSSIWDYRKVTLGQPRLEEAKEYLSDFPNVSQTIEYNTEAIPEHISQIECESLQNESFIPWTCPAEAE